MSAPQTQRHPRVGGDPVPFTAREQSAALRHASTEGALLQPIHCGDVTWVPAFAGMTDFARAPA